MKKPTEYRNPVAGLTNVFLNYSFRILHGDEIEQAKSVIYKVYHEEEGWTPPPNNASGYRIENGKFEDDLPETCTWLGVFDEKTQKLCSVCRILHGLEVVRYLDDISKTKLNSFENCCELHRSATLKEQRNNKLLMMLAVFSGIVAAKLGFRNLVTATQGYLVNYLRSGDAMTKVVTFRYSQDDSPSTLFKLGLSSEEIPSFLNFIFFQAR